jgi:uncharacterized protein YbjT (DUF2867 family)
VKFLLKDGTYSVRAVTRDAKSPKAQALKASGCEVVEANILDPASVEKAMDGSEAVFGVTNFWDKDNFNPEKLKQIRPDFTDEQLREPEFVQGSILVEAAKKAHVNFFVWSSLPNSVEVSNAARQQNPKIKPYHFPHFDQKAKVEGLLAASQMKYATICTGWFLENLWNFGASVSDGKGGLVVMAPKFKADVPNPKQAVTWVARDLGSSFLALLKHHKTEGSEIYGKTFYAVTAQASYEELCSALSKSLGKEVKFSAEGSSGMEEMDEMYEYQAVIGMYREQVIPDPRLVKWGVKFGTIEDFANDEVTKARLA